LPEFARLDYGDALKLAEREEVLVHGDRDRCAGGDGRTENRDILRITANVGREVSWHDRARHPRQEAVQLTNFAFGKVELIAKFAAELFGNEVGNHQFVMCEHVLEEPGSVTLTRAWPGGHAGIASECCSRSRVTGVRSAAGLCPESVNLRSRLALGYY
jgi:hypothetical protein